MDHLTQNSKLAIAVDIGTTKVCAIAGSKDETGKLQILGVGKVKSEGVSRGVVSNIDKTVNAITEAIRIAEEEAGRKFQTVHVGIAGQHIKSLHHHGLLVRDHAQDEIARTEIEKLISDMHKMVLPPGDQILHVLPQEFTVDDHDGIKDPIGMCGVRLEAKFHIITGQLTASKNILRCLERVGLNVAGMTLEPIASANAVLTDEEKEAGVAMVDIGGGTTDITIFKDGIIRHTAVVPFGGNVITNDIKEACAVLHDQAEKLKVRFGCALSTGLTDNRIISVPGLKGRDPKEVSELNLAKIIECRVEEIFDYVLWEIKRSGYENKLIAGLVLTGGGSLLRNIDELADYCTGLPSRLGEPIEHLTKDFHNDLASPIYSTSVGLLLTALEDVEYMKEEDVEVFDLEENNTEEEIQENPKDKKWINKIFTYTKEYFESTPDTEF